MSSIRNRTSSLLGKIEDVLQAGLAAKITEINADLDTAAEPYQLPSVPSGSIFLAVQTPDLPEHLPSGPHIKVVHLGESVVASSANRLGTRQVRVEVTVFMRYDHILGPMSGGSPLPAPASTDVDQQESILLRAVNDLAEAARLALCSRTSGIQGSIGVDGSPTIQCLTRVQDFDGPTGQITAAASVSVYSLNQRINYF